MDATKRCNCDDDPDETPWGSCPIHVACDEGCRALEDPKTVKEMRAALEHWRRHHYLGGCSHGG
jgi:hypothetical protein